MSPHRASANNHEKQQRDQTRDAVKDAHRDCRVVAPALLNARIGLGRIRIPNDGGRRNTPGLSSVVHGSNRLIRVGHGENRGVVEVGALTYAAAIPLQAVQQHGPRFGAHKLLEDLGGIFGIAAEQNYRVGVPYSPKGRRWPLCGRPFSIHQVATNPDGL